MKQPARLLLILFFAMCCISAGAQTTGGIGAMLQLDTAKDGTTLPRIKAIVPNSPSAAQNLPEGSYIMRVNEQPCKNKSLEEVVNIIRGEVGTTVTLSLADNAEGKKAKTYALVRAAIQTTPPSTPAVDPLEQLTNDCQLEVKQLKRAGHTIVKNVGSACGSYYFSFEGDAHDYHVKVFVVEAKGTTKTVDANVYDNSNEKNPIALKPSVSRDRGTDMVYTLEGVVSMKQNSVGVIKTNTAADVSKCKGMYIMVYK